MSNMQIEIVNVSETHMPTPKGGYMQLDVAYKNKSFQDKLEGKKIMDFANKEVYKKLKAAQFGDVFEVTREKTPDGKFWNWVSLSSGAGSVGEAPSVASTGSTPPMSGANSLKTGTVTPKSNYETAEERAARQVLIVRQSSISSAVELAVANKVKDPQEVIKIAKEFEAYVFGNEVKEEAPSASGNFFEDMEDDLP